MMNEFRKDFDNRLKIALFKMHNCIYIYIYSFLAVVVMRGVTIQPFTTTKLQCQVSNIYSWNNITIMKNDKRYVISFSNDTIVQDIGSSIVTTNTIDNNVTLTIGYDEKMSNCDAEGQYTCTASGVWGSTSVAAALRVSGELSAI